MDDATYSTDPAIRDRDAEIVRLRLILANIHDNVKWTGTMTAGQMSSILEMIEDITEEFDHE